MMDGHQYLELTLGLKKEKSLALLGRVRLGVGV
jgi:hypothetical protein